MLFFEKDLKKYNIRLLSKRFIKYMNKHLGVNFWITPEWAEQHYYTYCALGARRSITLNPNYHLILEKMEDTIDALAGK